MISIDGSLGEGGGQIVRSSLALSAVTAKPFEIVNVRAGRKKPGLLRQHMTAVNAVGQICGGSYSGGELGSMRLTFHPGELKSGDYRFRIGSAGSSMLVAQSVIPALSVAAGQSTVVISEAGTHNPASPPFEFFDEVYLPLLQRMGPEVSANLDAYGFYPAGGGKVTISVNPQQQLRGLELLERTGKMKPSILAVVSALPTGIGDRECKTIQRLAGWRKSKVRVHAVDSPRGPGNVVMIKLAYDNVSSIVTGFGKRGVSAEDVARGAYLRARDYIDSGSPVDCYLADQLMLPAGLAAQQGEHSAFLTNPLSQHSKTHLEILQMFLEIEVNVEPLEHERTAQAVAANTKPGQEWEPFKSVIVRIGPRSQVASETPGNTT